MRLLTFNHDGRDQVGVRRDNQVIPVSSIAPDLPGSVLGLLAGGHLDTLQSMTSAIVLYEKLGFEHLDKPLEGTIHNSCDVWMLKEL